MNYEAVKLEIFIPDEYVDALRDALSGANAGVIGNYDQCMSVTSVRGSWRPLPGATPYDGEVGQLSIGTESKVEVNCDVRYLKAALQAIYRVHPYEEPLINIVPLLNHLYPQ